MTSGHFPSVLALVQGNILGQRPAEAAADFATLCAFRAWEFQCSSFTPSGGTGSCGTGSWTGGRRNSGCSEASTATGSELPVLESEAGRN